MNRYCSITLFFDSFFNLILYLNIHGVKGEFCFNAKISYYISWCPSVYYLTEFLHKSDWYINQKYWTYCCFNFFTVAKWQTFLWCHYITISLIHSQMIQMSGLSGRPLFGSYLTMYSQRKACHLQKFFLLAEGLFVWAIFTGREMVVWVKL